MRMSWNRRTDVTMRDGREKRKSEQKVNKSAIPGMLYEPRQTDKDRGGGRMR